MIIAGRSRGFSLIEIMVSVAIIGIVMSVAVLSLNLLSDDRDVQKQARRFVALLDVAQDEAMMQGREFGVEVMRGAYRFVEYDPVSNQWAALEADDTLKLSNLPEDYEISLYLEDKEILLDAEPKKLQYDDRPGAPPNNFAPQLLIYSSGESTPFKLAVTRAYDQRRVEIEGDLLGNMQIIKNDDSM
ncbi:MAG TPA: type II secretion system minor pseudopilin GspH [Woeseiaceae bacterium]|nr:type II secretion system minor pseudopilin GspH [Woeseiaceae bacterium]